MDNTIECLGFVGRPPAGEFSAVTSGDCFSCGLRLDGTVACWGEEAAAWQVPASAFRQIDAGGMHVCGIRAADATVECWGANTAGQASPPGGELAYVSAGLHFTCGLTTADDVVCWGIQPNSAPPVRER